MKVLEIKEIELVRAFSLALFFAEQLLFFPRVQVFQICIMNLHLSIILYMLVRAEVITSP